MRSREPLKNSFLKINVRGIAFTPIRRVALIGGAIQTPAAVGTSLTRVARERNWQEPTAGILDLGHSRSGNQPSVPEALTAEHHACAWLANAVGAKLCNEVLPGNSQLQLYHL